MTEQVQDTEIRFDRFALQPAGRRLLVDGAPAKIGARAFDLLATLIERRDRTVSKNDLLQTVWPDVVVEENNLQVQVSALRKLLGPQAITTVPGRGYRFTAALKDGAAAAQAVASPAPPGPAATGNLPDLLPPLIGRADDLELLQSLLASHRVVTVVGAGGIGKTRLAQAAAHALREHWPDGCWVVELAPVSDPELLPGAVAQALGLTLPGHKAARDELLEALHGRAALLVLDNCEHLVEAVSALVEAMAAHASQLHLLVTSQELLKVHDEQLLRLAALAVPTPEQLGRAQDFGAVALFVERVAALQPWFTLNDLNVAEVADICRRLDGLPLAIELAAARVPLLGVAGVRARLDERLRLLTGGTRSALRRHQALREMLDWSHGLLDPDDQAVFRRAGVFVGGFALPAAQRMLADEGIDEWAVLDHLGTLVDKSLLAVDAGEPPRYQLLESARAYALEKLRAAGETNTLLRRHAEAMLAQFEQVHAQFWTVPSQVRERSCRPDIDNLRAALDWARDAGDRRMSIALTGCAVWLLGVSGMRLESLSRCDEALALVDGDTDPALEARLLLARLERAWPRYEAVDREVLARSIALWRQVGDAQALFRALANLAILEARVGDFDVSGRAIGELAEIEQPGWPPALRAQRPKARYWLLSSSGRHDEARAPLDDMKRLAEAAGDDFLRILALQYQEQTLMMLGRPDQAVTLGRELFELTRHGSLATMHAYTMLNLATALAELDQLDEALPLLREAATRFGRRGLLSGCLDALAMVALRQRRLPDAARVLGRADVANELRFGTEKRIRDLVEHALRSALPDDGLPGLMAEGAALSDVEAARLGFGD